MDGQKKNLLIVGGVLALAFCVFSTDASEGQAFTHFLYAIAALVAVSLLIGVVVGAVVFLYMLFHSANRQSALEQSFSRKPGAGVILELFKTKRRADDEKKKDDG